MKILYVTLVLVLGIYYPMYHALHMFQQNRYEFHRYHEWFSLTLLDTLFSSMLVVLLLALAGILAILRLWFVLPLVSIALLLYGVAMEKVKHYIKPLVVTNRVKRQLAIFGVLYAVCILGLSVLPLSLGGWLALVLSQVGPWLLLYLVALIAWPIEKHIQQGFKNKAKAILKAHDQLIKIGITGSYGKTTTKNVVHDVLDASFRTLMTPASFNTPMGITMTIRQDLKPSDEVFVCEMGADHVGEIHELMRFVKPQIGIVTSIGPQHLNTFGSQENIIHEKMRMIEDLPQDGFGILNFDNDFIRNYTIKNPVSYVTYGIDHADVDYHAKDIVYSPKGSSFTLVCKDGEYRFSTPLLGKLNILNILSAIACARYLKVPFETIQLALKNMKQVEHRLENKRINGYHFIDDAFNANPSGSKMALEVLGMMKGTRIIVTPGMIDLGEKQDMYNYNFGTYMKGNCDFVILVGQAQTKPIVKGLKDSGFEEDKVLVVDTVKEAFAYVYSHATSNDTILLENDLPDAFNR